MVYLIQKIKIFNRFSQFKTAHAFVLASLLGLSSSYGYIPPLDFILTKATSQTGRKIFSVDQEVTFKVGDEVAKFDETWLVEGDRNLKVQVRGQGLYKTSFVYGALYNNKNKTTLKNKNKQTETVGSDFFEKIIYARSKDSLAKYLNDLGISSNVKLSRASGVTTYLIGEPSVEKLNPHVWIGQDDFVVRKIRLPSEAEVTFSDITYPATSMAVAKTQVIKWAGVEITIRVKKVTLKPQENITSFYPQNFTLPTEVNFINKSSLTTAVETFYSRFR